MKKVKKNVKGVTMVALVVTIIVLLILSAITIGLTVGKNGLFSRSKKAADEHIKQEAMEAMNLKITGIQIESYTENQKLPNLQYLADKLCEDIEMEYVEKETKKQASLNKIDVTGLKSIFTKIKKYPYEFEIDSELKLASIDGVKIAYTETIPEGYIKPEGKKIITENGKNIDVRNYESVDINVQAHEILETGTFNLPYTSSKGYCEINIPLKNNYTIEQQACFIVTSVTNASYNIAWYQRAVDFTNIVENNYKTIFVNYAAVSQSGTISYSILGIANPQTVE